MMKIKLGKSLFVFAQALSISRVGAGPTNSASAAPEPSWPKAGPAAIARWQAMRFGMFIHWGPVSLTGHEIGWSRGRETSVEVYDNLYRQFNPANFNAGEWVSVARAAGMKYIVLTTKHHDGFCLWNTRQTDYNIMNSPFHRDVVKELAAACKKQGLAFGAYYSVCDWHHPDFPLTSPGGETKREKSDLDAYNRYLLAQISELVTNYGPLVTIWNDMPQRFNGRGANTIKLVRSLQPDITINDRTGDGGDYDTPEQRIGKFQNDHPWETCMTICSQWSWKPDDKMKSVGEVISILARTAGGDGNLLLNVGPMPDGRIEPRQVEVLKQVGAWMARNSESIYGTRGGPWKPTQSIASTRKSKTIYVHVLKWPNGLVKLPNIPAKIVSAKLPKGGKADVRQTESGIEISVAPAHRDANDSVVALKLDSDAMKIPALELPSQPTSVVK